MNSPKGVKSGIPERVSFMFSQFILHVSLTVTDISVFHCQLLWNIAFKKAFSCSSSMDELLWNVFIVGILYLLQENHAPDLENVYSLCYLTKWSSWINLQLFLKLWLLLLLHDIKALIIFSDGCGYQSRNATLSNAYFHMHIPRWSDVLLSRNSLSLIDK